MPIPLLLHGTHQRPSSPTVLYEPFGPWLVPWRFGSVEEEYTALRRGAGLIDYSTQAQVACRGADRANFLHRLLTNDIAHLTPGAGCPAALLTASAKLTAPLLVLCDDDAIWLVCDLPLAPILIQTLEQYHFSEDLALTNHERRWAVLAVEGPQALERIGRLAGSSISLSEGLRHATASLRGIPVRLLRHSITGAVGVWCLVEADHAASLWRLLLDARITAVGWEAFNTARIEAGAPLFGFDMDDTNLLPETGLETVLCSDTKGCYLGQEIVARMQTYGSANKKLRGLFVEGESIPQPGNRIARDGEEVGWVTSGCSSFALKRPIAMGYLKRGAYEPGTRVEILRETARAAAVVATRPLI